MERSEFREYIKNLYRGACVEGLIYNIDNCSDEELLVMYRRNIHYSLYKDIPNLSYFKHISPDILQCQGIICDSNFEGQSLDWGADKSHKGIYVINRCKGNLTFNNNEVISLHISNGCDLDIEIGQSAYVYITCYGYSRVKIKSSGRCRVISFQNTDVKYKGNVNFVKK